ncbi:MAG TPA: hypothetical protein VFI53_17590 [Myxococcaceae bacterium]|nr:hypothetical protein [Myxococcaceae bacterium]
MRRTPVTLLLGLLAVSALLGLGVFAGARADLLLQRDPNSASRALIYLPTPRQARLMAVGFDQVMADWYWVEALQYFTDASQEINRYRNLGDFLEVVVGIDPDFQYAYKFAGISIPYDTGRFHFANTDRAIDFLERGVKRFPSNWELHFHLGFYYLNFRDDPPRAAEQFAAAAKLEGSPAYLKLFAARLFSVSGELDRARVFAETMLASATDPTERAQLEKRIQEIDMERQLRKLEDGARHFHDQWGRWPTPAEVAVAYGLPLPAPGVKLENGVAKAPDLERMIVHEHPMEDRVRAAK